MTPKDIENPIAEADGRYQIKQEELNNWRRKLLQTWYLYDCQEVGAKGQHQFVTCGNEVILFIESILSAQQKAFDERLEGIAVKIEQQEKWTHHSFGPSYAKDNDISARLENELNDMLTKVRNDAISDAAQIIRSSVGDKKNGIV